MAVQSFRVTLVGVDFTEASDDADRVLERCDDVLLSQEPAGNVAIFDREATSFAAAVGSALSDLEAALPHAQVMRVEPAPLSGALSAAS